MDKVKVGQVVWLNSGGNPMTITGTETEDNGFGLLQKKGQPKH